MLNVEVYASRHFQEQPVRKYTISKVEQLENFKEFVLHSDEHYVHRIHCPDVDKIFECKPFTYYDPFMEFARDVLAQSSTAPA